MFRVLFPALDFCLFLCLSPPQVLPQIVPFDFGEESVNELDMVSTSCTVNKGDLPLDIYWTRNGGRVYTNDGLVVMRNNQRLSVLSIESVRARHTGNYTCVATNSGGVTMSSAILRVNGGPRFKTSEDKLFARIIFDFFLISW